jgi:hypothetical protein
MRVLSLTVVAVLTSITGCRGVSCPTRTEHFPPPQLDTFKPLPDGTLVGEVAERAIAARAGQVDLHEEEVKDGFRYVTKRYRDGTSSVVTLSPGGTYYKFWPVGSVFPSTPVESGGTNR